MQIAIDSSLFLLPVLYTLLISGYGRLFAGSPTGAARIVRPLLIATVAFHLMAIVLRGIQIGACPLGNRWESLSLVALAIAITYLLIELRTGDQRTGIFLVTAAFLLQFASSVITLRSGDFAADPRLGSMAAVFFVALIIGYSAGVVSGIYGLLYLCLYGAIKRGRFGLFFHRVPPLSMLSRQNHHAAAAALIALSVAIAAGVACLAQGVRPSPPLAVWDMAECALLWLVFAITLGAWQWFDLGAKRLAYGSVTGMAAAIALHLADALGEALHG